MNTNTSNTSKTARTFVLIVSIITLIILVSGWLYYLMVCVVGVGGFIPFGGYYGNCHFSPIHVYMILETIPEAISSLIGLGIFG